MLLARTVTKTDVAGFGAEKLGYDISSCCCMVPEVIFCTSSICCCTRSIFIIFVVVFFMIQEVVFVLGLFAGLFRHLFCYLVSLVGLF